MEDALKVYARPREWLDSDPQSDNTITSPKWDKPAVLEEQESTDEKALDRWFRELNVCPSGLISPMNCWSPTVAR